MSNQISISLATGFGWCDQRGPELQPDGTRCMTYRYLPAGLWNADIQWIRAMMNAAANVFLTYDEFPAGLLPAEPLDEGDAELTPAGKAFYESCPMYARLEAKEPWFTWHQYHPEGSIAWTARTNDYKIFLHQVVSDWPINLWAQKLMEPWKQLLDLHPKHGHIALHMQSPLPNKGVEDVDEEGWTKGLDNMRADIHERCDVPWGPFRVLLISCDDGKVKSSKENLKFTERFQLISCALAIRSKEDEPYAWREHHVWRFELPMHLLPRMIKWVEDQGMACPDAWGAKCISPCHAWNRPDFRFQEEPEKAGWETAAIIFKPLSDLDPVALAKYEHDFEQIRRPPMP